jgi:CARDB
MPKQPRSVTSTLTSSGLLGLLLTGSGLAALADPHQAAQGTPPARGVMASPSVLGSPTPSPRSAATSPSTVPTTANQVGTPPAKPSPAASIVPYNAPTGASNAHGSGPTPSLGYDLGIDGIVIANPMPGVPQLNPGIVSELYVGYPYRITVPIVNNGPQTSPETKLLVWAVPRGTNLGNPPANALSTWVAPMGNTKGVSYGSSVIYTPSSVGPITLGFALLCPPGDLNASNNYSYNDYNFTVVPAPLPYVKPSPSPTAPAAVPVTPAFVPSPSPTVPNPAIAKTTVDTPIKPPSPGATAGTVPLPALSTPGQGTPDLMVTGLEAQQLGISSPVLDAYSGETYQLNIRVINAGTRAAPASITSVTFNLGSYNQTTYVKTPALDAGGSTVISTQVTFPHASITGVPASATPQPARFIVSADHPDNAGPNGAILEGNEGNNTYIVVFKFVNI